MPNRISYALRFPLFSLALLIAIAIPAAAQIPANHVRVHYHRPDGNYSGWALYTWNASTEKSSIAVLQPKTQQAQFDRSISDQILMARLSISFAVLAVPLVAIGLYGTTSYNVTRRTSELGLRMALGAERGKVLWMVLRGGLVLCLSGIGLGLALVTACSQVLASLSYGVAPKDPVSLAAATMGILGIGLLATYLPARRAATIDPMIALRNE